METDIFRRRICNACGKVEYKPYLGAEKTEGGDVLDHIFEPSEYGNVTTSIEGKTEMVMTVCPECYRAICRYLRDIPETMTNRRAQQ